MNWNHRKLTQTIFCSLIAVFLLVGLTAPAAALEKEALITLKTTKTAQQTRQKECVAYLAGLDIERETCLKNEKTETAEIERLSAQRRIAGRLVTRCAQYISEKKAALQATQGAGRLTLIKEKLALEQTLSEQKKAQDRLQVLEQVHEKKRSAIQERLKEMEQEVIAYTGEIAQLETSIQALTEEITVEDALYAQQVLEERAAVEQQEQVQREQEDAAWEAAVQRAEQRWEAYQKEQQKEQQTLSQSQQGTVGGGSDDAAETVMTGVSLLWPVPTSQRITSNFGYRLHPLSGEGDFHRGLDIGAAHGAEVLAADSGVVVASFYGSSYGNHIILAHENGTSTLYAHLSSSLVSAGTVVQRGQTIGLVGSTGNSTGDHLHFEFWTKGTSNSNVNPLPYLSK